MRQMADAAEERIGRAGPTWLKTSSVCSPIFTTLRRIRQEVGCANLPLHRSGWLIGFLGHSEAASGWLRQPAKQHAAQRDQGITAEGRKMVAWQVNRFPIPTLPIHYTCWNHWNWNKGSSCTGQPGEAGCCRGEGVGAARQSGRRLHGTTRKPHPAQAAGSAGCVASEVLPP